MPYDKKLGAFVPPCRSTASSFIFHISAKKKRLPRKLKKKLKKIKNILSNKKLKEILNA